MLAVTLSNLVTSSTLTPWSHCHLRQGESMADSLSSHTSASIGPRAECSSVWEKVSKLERGPPVAGSPWTARGALMCQLLGAYHP